VLDSCDHETSGWPQLYETDPDFVATYQMLGAKAVVDNFHIQDGLLCRLGHICVPSSERAKLIWEAHYSQVEKHFDVEKTTAMVQKHFYWMKLQQRSGSISILALHSYNRALHSSTGHSPFQVGLGFQPLGPIDVALPLAVTSTDSSPAPTEAKKLT
jgi:hypothetical protein